MESCAYAVPHVPKKRKKTFHIHIVAMLYTHTVMQLACLGEKMGVCIVASLRGYLLTAGR